MNLPLNIDWQQILLHLLNFAILAGGLYFLLYQPVKKFMDQRTEHYQQLEQEAAGKVREAEQLRQNYSDRLAEADTEIAKQKEEAQRRLKASIEKQMEDADRQAAEIVSGAEQAAQRQREKTMKEAHKELQDMAITAAEKLVLNSDGDAFDQFLDAAERGMKREHAE